MARNTMKKHFSLKDHLFNRDTVSKLAALISNAYPAFKKEAFIKETCAAFPKLELKARIVWIAQMLEKYLPPEYEKAVAIIIKALPPALDPSKTDNDFGEFIFAPLGEFIVRNGTQKEDVELSLMALQEITQRFSMEDAIRTFINEHPKETFAALVKWSKHPHYHVRRLASEGTRPLLPWSKRITLSSDKTIRLLDALYADKTRYVTRSVANHVNDISKRDPELALATLARWEKEGKQEEQEWEWMKKHALRTLIKKGDKDALALLGHAHDAQVEVLHFKLAPASRLITPGEALEFSCDLYSSKDESVILDYCIDFVKKNGSSKEKVFKIKKLKLKKGEQVHIEKRHKFVKDATTFTFYPGVHTLTLLLNGKRKGSRQFKIR